MSVYQASIEISVEGVVMGHVPALPGCHARASSLKEVDELLIVAVREYLEWLVQHGEIDSAPEGIAIQVSETVEGTGPHHPGNRSALFEADAAPMMNEEMESSYLRRAQYARADLLALVMSLPDRVLDWQADEESMSIRHILRHIGNAEEWYVSRIVDPQTLPPQWEHDEDLPVFEFLAMERKTAFARLRALSEEERTRVGTPTHFTRSPGEQWTARKALRRLLEHEREHTAHIRRVLADYHSREAG